MRAIFGGRCSCLNIGRIRTSLLLGQRKSPELLSANEWRQPALFLFMGAKQEKRANADRVMRIREN